MRLGLIHSAWVRAGRGTAFGIRETHEIGSDTIDSSGDPHDTPMTERKLMERLEPVRGRVTYVPISHCDGKVHGDLPPDRGVADFPPDLDVIQRPGIDDAVRSSELQYGPVPDPIIEWVAGAYGATAARMRAAGLRG